MADRVPLPHRGLVTAHRDHAWRGWRCIARFHRRACRSRNAAAFGFFLLIAALWPGRPKHVAFLPDDIHGQTALHRSDLAILVKRHVEQLATIRSASATVHRSRVDVVVFSDADDLDAVREAASKKADEALEVFNPEGITRSRVRAKRVS